MRALQLHGVYPVAHGECQTIGDRLLYPKHKTS
jgi:hypothetical protein